jgi:hypothetical protein
MAQIDPSIAMSFRPIQIESPINQMAAVAQLRGAQEASQMNALKMQEYQQQQNDRNALARIMSTPGMEFGSDAFMNRVLTEAPSQYEGIATRAAQRENLLAQRETRQAETAKRNREMSIEQFQTAVGELASYNTVDDVLSGVQQKLGLGQITQAQADQVIAGLPKTDAELPAWQLRTMRNLLPPKERLADVRAERKDEREAARLELEDARLRETQRHQQAMESISGTQAERQLKQLEETQRHNKVMEGLASRRESTDKTKVANTTTDDQGNVTFYNAFGEKLRTEPNAGKRSPNIIKAEQAEKNLARDIERTTKELTDITQDGGLIDQSTGSYAGKAIDIGARVIGQAMPGDIAAGKLAPIADMVLKMVPRFEGPQSDKDTRSYKEAAGQLADTTLPREIRKEAGKTILRLMKERKDQFGSAETENVSPSQRQAAPPPPSGFVPDKK